MPVCIVGWRAEARLSAERLGRAHVATSQPERTAPAPTNSVRVALPQPIVLSALGPKVLIRVGVTRATLYCSSRQLCLGVYPSSRCAFSVDHALFVPSMRPRSCTSGQ